VQLHPIVIAQGSHEVADGDAESSLVEAHEAHDVALGGFGSVYSGSGEIHAGALESGFIGSSLSFTSCSKTATVAEDFPHGNGSWTSDISSSCGGMWGRKLRDG
jgi:hypothetical protein